MATKTYNAQTLLVAAKPRNKRLREIGYQGGSSATVDVDLTPYLLKATFDDLFEKVNIGTEEAPKWSIKAKYGLWTEQFLSAKGVGSDTSTGGGGGIDYEALEEYLCDNLAGYLSQYAKISDIPDVSGFLTDYDVKSISVNGGAQQPLKGSGNVDINAATSIDGSGHITAGALQSDGTIEVGVESGYSIPSNSKQQGWDAAKALLEELFEKVNLGTDSNPQWSIKAKYGLWTDQFLSAKGVGDGSAEGGVGYEAVQEMIADALAGYTPAATDVNWTDIVGKPDVFAPSAHQHTVADITDFAHTHSWTDITSNKPTTLDGYGITDAVPNTRKVSAGTGLTGGGALSADRTISLNATNVGLLQMLSDMFEWQTVGGVRTIKAKASLWTEGYLSAKGTSSDSSASGLTAEAVQEMIADALVGYTPGDGIVEWTDIVGKPDTFAPSSHAHTWDSITGKPSTFAPSAHSHTKSEITDFAHSHSKEDITDFAHDHAIADVTGLQTALNGKVPTSRTITAGTGLSGGGNLTTDRTIKLSDTNVDLLAMLSGMFEWDKSKDTTSGKTDSSKWVIKAKASLWTEGYLSAKGTSNDSSASGLTAEAVQEMIDDALVGYTPGDGVVEWTDIVGKPDTFAPSSHTHTWSSITGNFATLKLQLNGADVDTYNPLATSAKTINIKDITALDVKSQEMSNQTLLNLHGGENAAFYYASGSAGLTDIPSWDTTAAGYGMLTFRNAGGYYAQLLASTGNNLSWRMRQMDNTTDTGGWRRILDSGNYSSYALPLSGGTLTGNLTIGSNAIIGGDGQYMLGYKPASGFTGVSNTQWGVGASDSQGVIRSTNTNLIHYRNGASSPSSVILDSANYSSYITKSYIEGLKPYAQAVRDYDYHDFSNRRTSLNVNYADAALHYFLSTSSVTDGSWPCDGPVLHASWDNGSWEHQLVMGNGDAGMWHRGMNGSGWGSWKAILDSGNYSSYALPLSGGTLTGSLSVSGNVGIGTTSPSYKLHVVGSSGDLLWLDSSGTHSCVGFSCKANATDASGAFRASAGANGTDYYIWSNSRYQFQMNLTSGQIKTQAGIHIGRTGFANSFDEGIRIAGESNQYCAIAMGTSASAYSGATSTTWWLLKTNVDTFRLGRGTNSASGFLEILNSGNVGIGTTSPAYKLDVNGNIGAIIGANEDWNMIGSFWAPNLSSGRIVNLIFGQSNAAKKCGYIGFSYSASNLDANYLTLGLHSVDKILNITGAGNVGIGTTSPDAKLHVAGAVHATTGVYTEGYVTAQQSASSSDIRLKDIIGDYGLSVEKIANAPSVRFAWKDSGREDIGSIAQYWQEVSPHSVLTDPHGNLSLQYGKLGLLASISVARRELELEAEVERLKQEVEQLKAQIA